MIGQLIVAGIGAVFVFFSGDATCSGDKLRAWVCGAIGAVLIAGAVMN